MRIILSSVFQINQNYTEDTEWNSAKILDKCTLDCYEIGLQLSLSVMGFSNI